MAHRLSDAQKAKLTRVFNLFNAQGDGSMSEAAVRHTLSELGLKPEEDAREAALAEEIVKSLPGATTGKVGLPQFCR